MALPVMRSPFTGKHIVFDVLSATNSGNSVDEMVELGDKNPSFGDLTASDFASRVVCDEITKGDRLLNYNEYDQGSYFRNFVSISGELFVDPSNLAGFGNPDVGYDKPNLRDRSSFFAPGCFYFPAIVKLESTLIAEEIPR